MKVYLMARYGRRKEMLQVAADLEAIGHEVTSRWIRGEHEMHDELLNTDPTFRHREGARFATDDLHDLNVADCAIAFTEEPGETPGRGRGGRHFEAGVAYTMHWLQVARPDLFPGGLAPMRLILVGHRENVFMCLPEWEHFEDWRECRAVLTTEACGREA